MRSDAIVKALPNLDGYDAPQCGNFHKFPSEEVAWYATDDDRVLGIVIRDPLDEDNEDGAPPGIYFEWVLLTQKPEEEVVGPDTDDMFVASAEDLPAGVYRALECGGSWCRTIEEATAELHVAMLETHATTLRDAIDGARIERFGNGFGAPYLIVDRFGPSREELTVMSATEAAEFGIAESQRGRYYRVDRPGAAGAPPVPARDVMWSAWPLPVTLPSSGILCHDC